MGAQARKLTFYQKKVKFVLGFSLVQYLSRNLQPYVVFRNFRKIPKNAHLPPPPSLRPIGEGLRSFSRVFQENPGKRTRSFSRVFRVGRGGIDKQLGGDDAKMRSRDIKPSSKGVVAFVKGYKLRGFHQKTLTQFMTLLRNHKPANN